MFAAPGLIGIAALLTACEACRSTQAPPLPAASTGASTVDVGAPTLRFYFVSDMAGALEPCGCTKDQLGGLDHFGAWVASERAHAPASAVAAAGPLFFMNPKVEGDRAEQDLTKADTIARVMKGLGLVAFAPAANDWAAGKERLEALEASSGAMMLTDKWIVREIGGVKVGLIGVIGEDSVGAARTGLDAAKKAGAQVTVVLASVGRGAAKRIADALPDVTAIVVGSQTMGGEGNTKAPPAERIGNALIVETGNHLQSVAVLDLFVREGSPSAPKGPEQILTFADASGIEQARKRDELSRRIDELHVKISNWERDKNVPKADVDARKRDLARLESELAALDVRPPPATGSFFRYTVKEMRESLGKDASVEAQLSAYYKAVNDRNRTLFADRLPRPHTGDQATYIGIEACSACHPGARQVWNGTPHSHAYATLATQFKEYNLDCVSCHVTGYEQPGGSTVTHVDKLQNVQCENCHGPGSKHAVNPTLKGTIIAKPAPDTCVSCHHPPHVEDFDPNAKMASILGPGHGRR
jgi:hypothetical protein